MMLFQKALFLAKAFPKIDKNSNFLLNFHQKFFKIFSKFCQRIVFFVQTRENGFLNFLLQNRRKYSIFAIFLRIFLQIFENSQASRGLRPGPLTGPAITVNPLKFFPAYASGLSSAIFI